jgi:hypothetical protein
MRREGVPVRWKRIFMLARPTSLGDRPFDEPVKIGKRRWLVLMRSRSCA